MMSRRNPPKNVVLRLVLGSAPVSAPLTSHALQIADYESNRLANESRRETYPIYFG